MMDKMLGEKKIIYIAILSLVIIVVTGVFCLNMFLNSNKELSMERIEYRTDLQPLLDRFGETIEFDSCFWKADTIGKTKFGPSAYWMKGFIIINQDTLMEIKSKYPFIKADVHFDKGMSPEITNCSDFDWNYNKELSRKIAGSGFVGEIYLDINNGIFYFDLESK